jgi:hypothetical protein
VPYQVYQLTHSSLGVGLVSLAQLFPLIGGALLGGSVVDAMGPPPAADGGAGADGRMQRGPDGRQSNPGSKNGLTALVRLSEPASSRGVRAIVPKKSAIYYRGKTLMTVTSESSFDILTIC